MYLRNYRILAGLMLFGLFFVTACQLPQALAQRLGGKVTPTSSRLVLMTNTPPPVSPTAKGGSLTPVASPGVGVLPYPQPAGTTTPASPLTVTLALATSSPASETPDLVITLTLATMTPALPGMPPTFTLPIQPVSPTLSVLTATLPVYLQLVTPPAGVTPGSGSPAPVATEVSSTPGYPAPVVPQTGVTPGYPVPVESPNTPAAGGQAAPSPTITPTPSVTRSGASPTFTLTQVGEGAGAATYAPSPTLNPAATGAPVVVTRIITPFPSLPPALTATLNPTPTPSSTSTATFAPPPTSTRTPTRTPFLTPTPTLSPTPTITPTSPPLPPWISSRLRATNPATVKLAAGKAQLVMFFAYWSGISQAMAPVIHSLEPQYQDRAIFTYLDIDDPANAAFKKQLGFKTEPHFFLLDSQGKVLQQWVGYATYDQLRQALDAALR